MASPSRKARNRRRLEIHLKKRCYICYETKQEPSIGMPCCTKRVHETCLAKAFNMSSNLLSYNCPFCRRRIIPYNIDEPFFNPDNYHGDDVPFGFSRVTFIDNHPPQHNNPANFEPFYGNNDDNDDDDEGWDLGIEPRVPEMPVWEPPPVQIPPGFHEALNRIRANLRVNPRPRVEENVIYRPG